MRLRFHSPGFSLLELLVVIAIIAVLTAYVAPRFIGSVGKSEVQAARIQLDALEKALEAFRLDVGRYPTEAEGLEVLVERPAGLARWHGPYLKKSPPLDPWGNAYQYRMPGNGGADFDLSSFGPDGRPGGPGGTGDVRL